MTSATATVTLGGFILFDYGVNADAFQIDATAPSKAALDDHFEARAELVGGTDTEAAPAI